MGRFQASVLIDCPAETVWKFIVDPTNLTRTTPGAPQLRQTSTGPFGQGATLSGKDRMLTLVARVTVFNPNRRLVAEFLDPGFMRGTTDDYILETLDGKTRLTETWNTKLNGISKLLGPFFAPRTKRDVTTRLDNVKRTLESGTTG